MSTGPIEVAEEALQKLDELEIVDQESKDKAEKPRKVRLTYEEKRKIWEEKQALKPVLEKDVKGKVKWYSVRGKYGFITREDGKENIFVHQTAISKSPIVRYFLRTLADEEEVVFDIVEGEKGPEAANVTGPDGAEVQGSRYYHTLIKRGTTRRRESRPEGEKKEASKGEEEAKEKEEGKDDEKKKTKKKPKRQNRNRRGNRKTEKKADADAEEASSKADAEGSEEMEAKAPSRRRVASENDSPKKETKVASPEGSGDASLGALPADSAVC